MRIFVTIVSVALLAGCSTPEPRASAPAPRASGSASSFKERFAPRIASCTERAQEAGRTAQWTTSFCRCPYDVMADSLSPEEKGAVEEATFGAPQDGGAQAMRAIERVRPIVRERCGVNIGGPPR